MGVVFFTNPLDGNWAPCIYEEFAQLVLTRGEDYWNSPLNIGQAGLWIFHDSERKQVSKALVFSMRDHLGFHINYQHWKGNGTTEHWYPVTSTDFSSASWLHSAGEELALANALFISRADAIKVFAYFFKEGGMSPEILWLPSKAIPWDKFEETR
ncbi:MAG TPA: hypothetical protein VFE62_19705 [Gemmataceae bacterium]|nr:hypothetical protein [Gemmataceae bacterium]